MTSGCHARFLVTFDDGPHPNTAAILMQLSHNPIQQNIKAMFFVQTRNPAGGNSSLGRSLLDRECAEGHVLGLHTGTAGHVSHTALSEHELDQSLRNGMDDIRVITRSETMFVRPPYWRFNPDTLTGYSRHGLHMLLSDVKAYDGIDWGLHVFRRWTFHLQLEGIRRRLLRRELPTVDGMIPIVVTFHDTNNYTAGHLSEYFDLLIAESDRVGLQLDSKPFYDCASDITLAALPRTVHPVEAIEAESQPAEVS